MLRRNEISTTFIGWLYRPYFDLGDWEADGNTAVEGLVLAARSLVEGSDGYARVHATTPPSVRYQVVRHAMMPEYLIEDPGELRTELRSSAWQVLCDHLAHYRSLDRGAKFRTLWVLHRLGLHASILRYEKGRTSDRDRKLDDDEFALVFMRGLAKYALANDGLPANGLMDELRQVESMAAPGSWAHMEATYLLANTCMKMLGDVEQFRVHLKLHEESVNASGVVGHEWNKLLSRYHRIAAMLPQLEGDYEAMTREMDRAEHHCDLMLRDDLSTKAEWGALRFALLESRTKEMFVRGDFERAEWYALSLIAHMPSDPHAYLALGQAYIERENVAAALKAYRMATLLGPQVTHLAQFMLGQCLEYVGDIDAARMSYLQAVASDPLGISTMELLRRDGVTEKESQLRRWLDRHSDFLHGQHQAAEQVRSYQKYAGKMGPTQ
ncbi:tetratricopeptide repeat protein [Streptomyces sp. NPDC059460]|uniref:tetratricopeptide repeat protein n=1 Tax=Streptomyces sp. NPDC059460 TaxID=3346840 RepID=UPI00367DAB2C